MLEIPGEPGGSVERTRVGWRGDLDADGGAIGTLEGWFSLWSGAFVAGPVSGRVLTVALGVTGTALEPAQSRRTRA